MDPKLRGGSFENNHKLYEFNIKYKRGHLEVIWMATSVYLCFIYLALARAISTLGSPRYKALKMNTVPSLIGLPFVCREKGN